MLPVDDVARSQPMKPLEATFSETILETSLRFDALDGYRLGGTIYRPRGRENNEIAVFINCGGGVPARFYRRFARFLAEVGIPVLTYDYRGIGRSKPRRLRGFAASAEDWSEYDCGGAIKCLRNRFPRAELVGMAHSVGALLLGGAPNANELSRFVLIGAHTGYYGDYQRRYRFPMAVLWHGVMPALTRVLGYFPASWLRLGDDIPRGVALQWAGRRTPDLATAVAGDRARARRALERCGKLRGNALAVSFSDDAFATDAGIRRLLSFFPQVRAERLEIRPCDVGLPSIGHFGFFREGARRSLWPAILAYLLHAPIDLRQATHRQTV
jgi:predicted alpha/beta hydrolase